MNPKRSPIITFMKVALRILSPTPKLSVGRFWPCAQAGPPSVAAASPDRIASRRVKCIAFSPCRSGLLPGGPVNNTPFADANHQVQGDADGAEQDERGEHAGHVGHGLSLDDSDADSLLRAQELGDDGAENGIDHAHVEAGEDVGRGRRQLDEAISLKARG